MPSPQVPLTNPASSARANPSSQLLTTTTANLSFKPEATIPAQSATALMAHLTTLARANASAQLLSSPRQATLSTLNPSTVTKRYRADGPPHYPRQGKCLGAVALLPHRKPLLPTTSHYPCTKRYRAHGLPHYPCQDEPPPPDFFRCYHRPRQTQPRLHNLQDQHRVALRHCRTPQAPTNSVHTTDMKPRGDDSFACESPQIVTNERPRIQSKQLVL